MKEYHKIQTVFKRDPATNMKTLLEGEYSMDEFELLKDIEWTWTEKVDGTNMRLIWDGKSVEFRGKTDNAQTPKNLLEYLESSFGPDNFLKAFPDFSPSDNAPSICLYGEGFGNKIQNKVGGRYLGDKVDFILFDVKIGPWWLRREDVEDVASKMDSMVVPIIGKGPLLDAVDLVRQGFTSTIAQDKTLISEGLIMKPSTELFNRSGKRIISKIKHRDFPRN